MFLFIRSDLQYTNYRDDVLEPRGVWCSRAMLIVHGSFLERFEPTTFCLVTASFSQDATAAFRCCDVKKTQNNPILTLPVHSIQVSSSVAWLAFLARPSAGLQRAYWSVFISNSYSEITAVRVCCNLCHYF